MGSINIDVFTKPGLYEKAGLLLLERPKASFPFLPWNLKHYAQNARKG